MTTATTGPLRENFELLLRPGQETPVSWERWALVAVLVLLAGIVAYFQYRRHRRIGSADHPSVAGEPADVVALRELQQWDGLSDERNLRHAVAAVSGTVRRYVGCRFGLEAPRLTTEEFWARLRGARPVPVKYDPFFERFMGECDLIKYAGVRPSVSQFRSVVTAAVGFVQAARKEPS